MIDSSEISVIVQGAINSNEAKKCLKSIRNFLPKAEIILSTWENSDVSGLDYDKLILNKDPGAVTVIEKKGKKFTNNMNRQLLTIKEGLKKADRKYVLKLRSDLILTNNTFLNYFDKFQERNEKYKLFKRKILISTLFSRYNINCRTLQKRVYLPFHVSDWWFFGLNEDLKTYFNDTPLALEPEFTNYFDLEENKNKITPYDKTRFKFAPEQYFAYTCFNRNFDDIYMEDAADFNDELIEKARIAFVNNFIAIEYKQSGIYLNKYLYSKNEYFIGDQYIGLYNNHRYESEYKKYCKSDYEIVSKDDFMTNEKLAYARFRMYKHFAKLFEPNSTILQKIEQLSFGIAVSVIKYLYIFLEQKFSRCFGK